MSDPVNPHVTNAADSILRGKKILWVEDDKLLGGILSRKMISYGCDLTLAKDGIDAFTYLDTLKPTVPDVLVLDLSLPGMSGFDILKKFKDDPINAKVPVMILSNLNQSADLERAKILGAQKFLVKAAMSLDAIMHQIAELLRS